MKKAIISFVVLTSLAFTLVCYVYAVDVSPTEDQKQNHINPLSSTNIEANVLSKLGLDASADILKIYDIDLFSAFNNYDSIEGIMNSEYIKKHYYAVCLNDEITIYMGDLSSAGDTPLGDYMLDSETGYYPKFDVRVVGAYFEEEIIQKVSPTITVYNVYYLNPATYDGTVLYYETNMGDFAYYRTSSQYLMPGAVFFDYIREKYQRLKQKNPHATGGVSDKSWTIDMSYYKMDSEKFDPQHLPEKTLNIPAILIGAVMVGVAIFIILRPKRDNEEYY